MFVAAETRFGNKEILIYWCGHVRLDMACHHKMRNIQDSVR